MNDNIRVVVKVRPLISRELDEQLQLQWRVKNNSLVQIDSSGREHSTHFTFDNVYDVDSKNSDIYKDVAKPIVEAAIAGINGTIFAYGQTSSGKTFTMSGTEEALGIIPLAVYNLFEIIKKARNRDFLVRVSYIEIYNDNVRDLLDVNKKVKVKETFQGVKVVATERMTASPEEVLEAMRQGEVNRQMGATNMNEESSRSHAIFQIIIESREHVDGDSQAGCVNVSQLNLVDLAGSERAGQTGATGKRFTEGTHINKSLSVLGLVINQLSDGLKHVNYRDSRLTRILQNSLGGNAKTSIICAVTPASVEETISTLQFANRAKKVKNRPEVNEVTTDATMIQDLTKKLGQLQLQLEKKKHIEHDNAQLSRQIANLQKLILNGFGQRSTEFSGSNRRKTWCAPRRATISTLSSIDEGPDLITLPKFCTPVLKYNPHCIQGPSDFVPIENAGKLKPVAEETDDLPTDGQVTPTPSNKKVNFNDEIIEIDSDEDSIEINKCSPYHGCYGASETPPCVLRKMAKKAEKEFKDILEMTELEKMYPPNIVELMELAKQKTDLITELEGKLNTLEGKNKESDTEIKLLKEKVNEAEEILQNVTAQKVDLETQCKEYHLKLIDWEVTCETLKKNAKSREQELLALLDEKKPNVKKPPDFGKLSRTMDKELNNFMDLSKDLSLVHSDNETSIHSEEDQSSQLRTLVEDMQLQLADKNTKIIELENNLIVQKQLIASLENSSQELHKVVAGVKDKVIQVEQENMTLKALTETLNETISNQKHIIDSNDRDIESYTKLIQELQITLKDKEKLMNISINDSILETMITNEERFITNNENLRNIIYSFKKVLESRDKEISVLKSKDIDTVEYDALKNKLENKNLELKKLFEDWQQLQSQLSNNVVTINNLMQDKCNLTKNEVQLTRKLDEMTNKVTELESLPDKILRLEKQINSKDSSLIDKTNKIKDIVLKLQDLTALLNLNHLDDMSLETPDIFQVLDAIKCTVTEIKEHSSRQSTQQSEIKMTSLNNSLQKEPLVPLEELTWLRQNLEIKTKESIDYKAEIDKINIINEKLNLDLTSQVTIITNLTDEIKIKAQELLQTHEKYTNVYQELQKITADYKEDKQKISCQLSDKINTIDRLEAEIVEKNTEISTLQAKVADLIHNKDKDIISISDKACTLFKDYIDCRILDEYDTTNHFEHINTVLEQVCNRIKDVSFERQSLSNDLDRIVCDTREGMTTIISENSKLKESLCELENKHSATLRQMADMKKEIEVYEAKFFNCNDLLQTLQQEIKEKTIQMNEMQSKFDTLQKTCTKIQNVSDQQLDYYDSKHDHLITSTDHKKPESLVTLSLNTVIDSLQSKDNDTNSITESSSKSFLNMVNVGIQVNNDEYINLLRTFKSTEQNNFELNSKVKKLETENKQLQEDQDQARAELILLVECMEELQKKIINHKTNLATLTATTYAENKRLKLLVKVLKHQQNRCHSVCDRDLPEFKTQLYELLSILKDESSFMDKSSNCKRYSLPDILDGNSSLSYIKNDESTLLDGDLLMLDTNVTFTSANNTVIGCEQPVSCLNLSQIGNEGDKNIEPKIVKNLKANDIFKTNEQLLSKIEVLSNENKMLHEEINKRFSDKVDVSISPIKPHLIATEENEHRHNKEIISLTCRLSAITNDKVALEEKYNALLLEVDTLVKKISTMEIEFTAKISETSELLEIKNKKLSQLQEKNASLSSEEIDHRNNEEIISLTHKLSAITHDKVALEKKYDALLLEVPATDTLVKKLSTMEKEYTAKINEISKSLEIRNKQLSQLQEENETLSTQVFENITEVDELKKELDEVKKELDSCKLSNFNIKQKCIELEELCKTTEDITYCINCCKHSTPHAKLNRSLSDSESSSKYNKISTLQNQLQESTEACLIITEEVEGIKVLSMNQTMEIDDSIGEPDIFNVVKHLETSKMSTNDTYVRDKLDCFNFVLEKTGSQKENLKTDIKIIELLKMLYNYMATIHSNEIKNSNNKLKDFEETTNILQKQLSEAITEHGKAKIEVESHNNSLQLIAEFITKVRNNINVITNFLNTDEDKNYNKLLVVFKDSVLSLLDKEMSISTTNVFDYIIDSIVAKHQTDLSGIMDKYTKLQAHMEGVTLELNTVNKDLHEMKTQLSDKEKEYNSLKLQKDKTTEINNAITLDIIKHKKLFEIFSKGCQKLVEFNLISSLDVDASLPLDKNIDTVFKKLIEAEDQKSHSMAELVKSIENLKAEIDSYKSVLKDKEKEIESLKDENIKIKDHNNNICLDLQEQGNKLANLNKIHDDLKMVCQSKEQELNNYLDRVEQLLIEKNGLVENINTKDVAIQTLQNQLEVMSSNEEIQEKKIFDKICKLEEENENLKKINETMSSVNKGNSVELENCYKTINDNKTDLDKLLADILSLRETVKVNLNVIDTLKAQVKSMQNENEIITKQFENKNQETVLLGNNVKTLEKTIEIQCNMISRLQKQINEVTETHPPKELLEKYSVIEKERNSLIMTLKQAHEDLNKLKNVKETLELRISELETEVQHVHKPRSSIEENSRRRRQSIHDSMRTFAEEKNGIVDVNKMEEVFASRAQVKPDDLFMDVDEEADSNRSSPLRLSKGRDSLHSNHDQSPEDRSASSARRRRQSQHDLRRTALHTPEHTGDLKDVPPQDKSTPSEISELRKQLADVRQELDELKEKYKELDEECEICGEYLKERDAQCMKLTKEKEALQAQLKQLSQGAPLSSVLREVTQSAVNTEQGHNKLDDPASNKSSPSEVSQLKKQLANVRQELDDLQEKYKELDEECEICGEYLKERDAQCMKLLKEKEDLQNQLKALSLGRGLNQSSGKREVAHVAVNTEEDWANLYSVVVDRMSFDAEVEKNKTLNKALDEMRLKNRELKSIMTKMQKKLELPKVDHREHEALKSELESCRHELGAVRARCAELSEEYNACDAELREREHICRRLREDRAALEDKLAEHEERAVAQSARRKRQTAHDLHRAAENQLADVATQTTEDLLCNQVERDHDTKKYELEIHKLKTNLERACQRVVTLETSAANQPLLVAAGSGIVQNQQMTDILKENHKLRKYNAKLITLCQKRGKSVEAKKASESTTEEHQNNS